MFPNGHGKHSPFDAILQKSGLLIEHFLKTVLMKEKVKII